MKKVFLFLIIAFSFLNAYSQEITIKLSLSWQNQYVTILDGEVIKVPYLNIQYQNNSESPVYFVKICQNDRDLPQFSYLPSVDYASEERAVTHKKMSHKAASYEVILDDNQLTSSGLESFWQVFPEASDKTSYRVNNQISEDIGFIYSAYRNSLHIRPKKTNYPAVINEKTILNEYKDWFVFLNPGESYVDTYNLIGFKILGGNYRFHITQKELQEYIYANLYWDELIESAGYRRFFLPKTVSHFHLYHGSFKKNELKVTFE